MARSCIALVKALGLVLLCVQSCACGEVEIIGGKKVKAHSLPYMVLLLNSTGQPVCGGTLISSRWVLTAAHCLGITTVNLGVDSIKKRPKDESVQVRELENNYKHPNYNRETYDHDLRLLLLNQEMSNTKSVKYLPLTNVIPDPEEDTKCMVAGWGSVSTSKETMSDVLMSADVSVISRETCNSINYNNSKYVITSEMVCAGTPENSTEEETKDTCKGDSGGPLICNGVQVGITSFGIGCADRTKPGVYTFLSKAHLDWIKKTMQKKFF